MTTTTRMTTLPQNSDPWTLMSPTVIAPYPGKDDERHLSELQRRLDAQRAFAGLGVTYKPPTPSCSGSTHVNFCPHCGTCVCGAATLKAKDA